MATASLDTTASQLLIESEVVIQQYNEDPLDFLVDDYALHFPFPYTPEDLVLLAPYRLPRPEGSEPQGDLRVSQWLASIRQGEEAMETYGLLQHLCDSIHASLTYVRREEPGVQTGAETLSRGAGSCSDFAARFVSGYLHTPPSTDDFGSTHAWADHIAVAVARRPEAVPPVAGSFVGALGARLSVGVWVSRL